MRDGVIWFAYCRHSAKPFFKKRKISLPSVLSDSTRQSLILEKKLLCLVSALGKIIFLKKIGLPSVSTQQTFEVCLVFLP
jgi:hypothetical protein